VARQFPWPGCQLGRCRTDSHPTLKPKIPATDGRIATWKRLPFESNRSLQSPDAVAARHTVSRHRLPSGSLAEAAAFGINVSWFLRCKTVEEHSPGAWSAVQVLPGRCCGRSSSTSQLFSVLFQTMHQLYYERGPTNQQHQGNSNRLSMTSHQSAAGSRQAHGCRLLSRPTGRPRLQRPVSRRLPCRAAPDVHMVML
jgi:hypothetical protein